MSSSKTRDCLHLQLACRRVHDLHTLTRLRLHAYSYTPTIANSHDLHTLTRLRLHAYSDTPTLANSPRLLSRTRLPPEFTPCILLHAYAYTPTLTRLLSHAYADTPTLANSPRHAYYRELACRRVHDLHTLRRLLLHAYSHTPTIANSHDLHTLTRLRLHAYSYTPTLANSPRLLSRTRLPPSSRPPGWRPPPRPLFFFSRAPRHAAHVLPLALPARLDVSMCTFVPVKRVN
jgi:hypothetical protein